MTARTAKIIMTGLFCASTLLQPISAYAESATKSWQYVPQNNCATAKSDESSSSSDQAQPSSSAGDWTQVGTERYNNAKKVFDILTDTYGWSGAAAAGAIGNIAGESGFIPNAGEWAGTGHADIGGVVLFDMNSKTPPHDFYYADAGGGGGLAQFTPYTKFTESAYWSTPNSEKGGGWYIENQLAFIWASEFQHAEVQTYYDINYTRAANGKEFASTADFMRADNPESAARYFQLGYERPLNVDPRRAEWARVAYELFDGASKKADESKWKANGFMEGSNAVIDGTSSSSSSDNSEDDLNCEDIQEGAVDTGIYIELAKQYAADKKIGYSQGTRQHNPNMDCSSFVWYCLTESGAVDAEKLGGVPFSTDNEPELLKSAGFTEMNYSVDKLQKGDILWRDGHTEIYLGKYDVNKLDSDGNPTEDEQNGVPISIGAHWDENHGLGGQDGDQLQEKDGNWFGQQEVGGTQYLDNFTKIYRPTAEMLSDHGSGQEYKKASAAAKRIVQAAKSTPSPGGGLCMMWVSQVYAKAGLGYPYGNANDNYYQWAKSSKKSDLKVGMVVAVPVHTGSTAGAKYGHIGIYIGDGMIMDNVGYVRTETLDEWISYYGSHSNGNPVRWGYASDAIK